MCPNCKEFDSLQLMTDDDQSSSKMVKVSSSSKSKPAKTYTVSELSKNLGELHHIPTGVVELDRLLMGGMVEGQVILIGAEPGFGKSTLCLEVLGSMSNDETPTLYASGEESERQIGQRAERLRIDNENLHILSSKSTNAILTTADELHAKIMIVDSLQAMETDGVTGSQGGSAQSKEAAYLYTEWAKKNNAMVFLIAQFTKGDEVAGSNMISHVVDTILVGESDSDSKLKFLRSKKNRYGRTDEVAVFVHEEDGLKSVTDPSGYLIGDDPVAITGSAMSIMRDGIRMLPVEVNALVVESSYSNPQRQFSGMDSSRAKILVAALSKYADDNNNIAGGDVFANTINGIKITDTMADMAIIASIASSAYSMEPKYRTVWCGEVTLTGRVRGRSMINERVRESIRLGFERIVIPLSCKDMITSHKGIIVDYADTIQDVIKLL
jgi:DNA repair protein RadA/Sms